MKPDTLHGRKGLSPLIATILLIAFAVALGVVLINLFNNPLTSSDGTSGACQDVALELATVPGGKSICYAPQQERIEFIIENVGQEYIPLIILRGVDRRQNRAEQEVRAELEPGRSGKYSLPFSTVESTNATATLIPYMETSNGVQACPTQKIELVGVPLC